MFAALLSTLILGASPSEELKSLEGVWTVERMEQKGKKFPTDLVATQAATPLEICARPRVSACSDVSAYVTSSARSCERLPSVASTASPPRTHT